MCVNWLSLQHAQCLFKILKKTCVFLSNDSSCLSACVRSHSCKGSKCHSTVAEQPVGKGQNALDAWTLSFTDSRGNYAEGQGLFTSHPFNTAHMVQLVPSTVGHLHGRQHVQWRKTTLSSSPYLFPAGTSTCNQSSIRSWRRRLHTHTLLTFFHVTSQE